MCIIDCGIVKISEIVCFTKIARFCNSIYALINCLQKALLKWQSETIRKGKVNIIYRIFSLYCRCFLVCPETSFSGFPIPINDFVSSCYTLLLLVTITKPNNLLPTKNLNSFDHNATGLIFCTCPYTRINTKFTHQVFVDKKKR